MKLLWLCNMAPGFVRKEDGKGLWMDHVLAGLRRQNITMRILFPGQEAKQGSVHEACSFVSFKSALPYRYIPEQELLFEKELQEFQPDVIHIWGTEYAHTLAMLHACEKYDFLNKTVINIQGLCSVIARHYTEGLPYSVQRGATFRDVIRLDNVLQQQKKFLLRGENEAKALQKVHHVIGRTCWDKACMEMINPNAHYHFCNETMRDSFYNAQWSYVTCQKHNIFASSCEYPVKGFHYLLEAFGEVVKSYPDATLTVPGKSFFTGVFNDRLHQTNYQKYLLRLAKENHIEDKVVFLGSLRAEQMREAYLRSNVFVLPSTSENSPNSLGEAMLLGVPCVASDVGGVSTMMEHNKEGFIYQSTAPYMLAHYIKKVFEMEEKAKEIGEAARQHALKTHDPETNLKRLLEIYEELAGC